VEQHHDHEYDDDHPAGSQFGFGSDAKEQLVVYLEQPTLTTLVALPAVIAQVSPGNAPGDAYFGRLNMSTLRIRYETMQLKKRYETHQPLPEQTEHLLRLTDDAYVQWGRRYPRDAWLPSTGFLIEQLYEELPGPGAQARAGALLRYIATNFPKSPYGAKSRVELHRGVQAKPYPAWARPTPSPAPRPTPSASASPSHA
jgi:hypothetical protein